MKIYEKVYKKFGNRILAFFVSVFLFPILILIFAFSYLLDLLSPSVKLRDKLESKMVTETKVNNMSTADLDLSIIIPVYNGEKYIKRCLDSILNSDSKYEYEIIVVNDGSTDSSLDVLKTYNDKKVIILNKNNGGVSSARNSGIEAARGRYISFVDIDDYVEEKYIDIMLDNIGDNDAIFCGYNFFDDNGLISKNYEKDKEYSFSENESLIKAGYPWGKVFKREIFNVIRFPVGYYFEDTIMCYLVYPLCKKIKSISFCLYDYYDNYRGATRTLRHTLKALDTYYVVDYCFSKMKELNIAVNPDLCKFTINTQLSYIMLSRINGIGNDLEKKIFCASCDLVDKFIDQNVKYNLTEKKLLYSFKNKKYSSWKVNSYLSKFL